MVALWGVVSAGRKRVIFMCVRAVVVVVARGVVLVGW